MTDYALDNVTVYVPSFKATRAGWKLDDLDTGPIVTLTLGEAPFIVLRSADDVSSLVLALWEAAQALREAQARHAAASLVPDRDSDVGPDPYINAMAAEHVTEFEPGLIERTPAAAGPLTAAVEANARILAAQGFYDAGPDTDEPLPDLLVHRLEFIDRDTRPATWTTSCGAVAPLERTTSVEGNITCHRCREPLPDLLQRDPGHALDDLAAEAADDKAQHDAETLLARWGAEPDEITALREPADPGQEP